MKIENHKLLKELSDMTRVDEKVVKILSRDIRTREIKESADSEMKVAANFIKEAY